MRIGMVFATVAFALALGAASAQPISRDYALTIKVSPVAMAALSRTDLFGMGGGVDVGLRWELPFTGVLGLEAAFGYRLDPVGSVDSLSLMAAEGGLAASLPIKAVEIGVFARGGYWWAFRNGGPEDSASNPSVHAGLSLSWSPTPALGLAMEAGWHAYLGLHDSASVALGAVWHLLDAEGRRRLLNVSPELLGESELPAARNSGLLLSGADLSPVYPVLFKLYDSTLVGTARLENRGRKTVDDIEVTFHEPQYMSTATACDAPKSLKGGASAEVGLHALFKADVLGLSEGSKVMARISVAYTLEGRRYRYESTVPLTFLHRNAISWDDDRKAAVFVTAKDPAVLSFARAASAAADSLGAGDLDHSFLYAMTIFDALGVAGLNYKSDPVTPYERLSADELAVDYLQFPVQTLEYRSGDCDDLSVLFCALLESIGVETAFITVPGHILCAFALGGASAAGWFSGAADFIEAEGKLWVPVEATLAGRGFLEAWKSGVESWKSAKAAAALYPTRAAWTKYPPVGFDLRSASPEPPPAARVAAKASIDLAWLAEREAGPRIAALAKEAGAAAGEGKFRNRAGVIYARYGLDDKAEAEFKAAASSGYGAARVNLGSLQYRAGKTAASLATYRQAATRGATFEAPAVEGIIRCCSVLGDLDGYAKALARLKEIDPARAERLAFLVSESSGERAASAAGGSVAWVE